MDEGSFNWKSRGLKRLRPEWAITSVSCLQFSASMYKGVAFIILILGLVIYRKDHLRRGVASLEPPRPGSANAGQVRSGCRREW
jgi:hypothetical protein